MLILFVVFVKMYLILILVLHQKTGFQFPQKGIKETCSRKMVLVPYGDGECELGNYACSMM
jgi:hypothetical protein